MSKGFDYDLLFHILHEWCDKSNALGILLTRCEVKQSSNRKYYIEYTGIADIPFNEKEVETLKKAGIIKCKNQ